MTITKPNRDAIVQVAVGVVLGVGFRWSIGIPLGTVMALLVVNFLGCGVFAAAVHGCSSASRRRTVGVGFCGGLTTMSGAAVAVAQRFDNGAWSTGVGVGLAVGLAASGGFVVGLRLRRLGLGPAPR